MGCILFEAIVVVPSWNISIKECRMFCVMFVVCLVCLYLCGFGISNFDSDRFLIRSEILHIYFIRLSITYRFHFACITVKRFPIVYLFIFCDYNHMCWLIGAFISHQLWEYVIFYFDLFFFQISTHFYLILSLDISLLCD